MLYFENDYCEGAHPAILQKLTETNFEKVSGYGTDPYCASAKEKICAACRCPEADVTFISGGTQTNAIVIASMLHRWEGVVAAATGHVNGHEAGAIESTGHKVMGLPHKNGKLDAATVRNFCATFYADDNHEHMVIPGMVYISFPTEYGTPLHQGRTGSSPRGLSGVQDAPLRGWRTAGLRSGGGWHGRHPARPRKVGRCVLHRRQQGRCSLRRGRCLPPRCAGPLHDHG